MASDNLKTGPVRGGWPGVAAIQYDGSRYCLDCAEQVLDGEALSVEYDDGDWDTIESADGTEVVEKLITGEIHTLGQGGVTLNDVLGEDEHCSCGGSCENAIPGHEHDYGHDETIGVKLGR